MTGIRGIGAVARGLARGLIGTLSGLCAVLVADVAAAQTCSPISTLPCIAVPVSSATPYRLSFSGGAGGLSDTGFTLVQVPSVNRYPATPSDPATPGYEPSLISVAGGVLSLTATRGHFYQTPGQNTANNTQVNALGMAFDATTPRVLTVQVLAPAFPDTSNSEQAGLWFGLDDDNYVKLAVVNRTGAGNGLIELRREIAGVTTGTGVNDVRQVDVANTGSSAYTLELRLDPTSNQVSGRYVSSNGESGLLGPLTVPASFFTGQVLPDGTTGPLAQGGLFGTSRFNTTTTLVYAFDNFGIEPPGSAPVASAETIVLLQGATATTLVGGAGSVLANDSDADGDPLIAQLISGPANGSLALNADGTFSYAHDGGAATSDSFTYVAIDGSQKSAATTVSVAVTPFCGSIGIGACSTLPVSILSPYSLTFGSAAGGLSSTGFTIVQAPSVNRYPPTPYLAAVPGYEPANLGFSSGRLVITSTRGQFYQTPLQNTANNTQVNALGVPFAMGLAPIKMVVEVIDPAFPDTSNSEQAGLWLGLGEDDYVKLAVVNRTGAGAGMIELRREVAGVSTGSGAADVSQANVAAVTAATIRLQLEIDPATNEAVGRYASSTGETGVLGPLTVPASFIAGQMMADGVTGPVTYGGVYASSRFNTTTPNIPFSFDNFSIGLLNTAPIAAVDSLSVSPGGTAITLTGGATSVLANDNDPDGDPLTADLVAGPSNGTLTLNSDGTFSYSHDGGISTSDSFTYRASDGVLTSNTVTVSITISDATPPTLTSVTVPLAGTYSAGQALDFVVTFNEPVTVDTSGGVPRIAVTLDVGGTVYADYLSGSGSSALTFRLTIAPGWADSDGVVLGSAIDPNGGTIRDAAGNNAMLTLAGAPSTSGVLISAPPVIASVPTLSEWAMVLLAGVLGLLACARLRRRQAAAKG